MAEEHQNKSHEFESTVVDQEGAVETTKDRGVFDFLGKKEEENQKPQEEVILTEFEKIQVSEPEFKVEEPKEEEEKKPCLLEKLHRSNSSSSSSSTDEEEGEDEEKMKKKKKKEKKGLKQEEKHEDTVVPVEVLEQEIPEAEEKKGLLDKIKEKLPVQHKKTEEVLAPPPPPPPPVEVTNPEAPCHEGEAKEKKGFLEKIKEKLPGFHPKAEEEKEKVKEEEKESVSH